MYKTLAESIIDLPDGISDWAAVIIVLILAVLVLAVTTVKQWGVPGKLDSINKKLANDDQRIKNVETINDDTVDKFERLEESTDRRFNESEKQHAAINENINQMNLNMQRNQLFQEPKSKEDHERLLDVGIDYSAHGGNGAGHLRISQLQEDYARRLKLAEQGCPNAWDYTKRKREDIQ